MTAREAYDIVNDGKGILSECCDFGEFYGFIFKEKPDDEPFGTAYQCVDKKTGERFDFEPFDDFDVFDKGINIKIKDVLGDNNVRN